MCAVTSREWVGRTATVIAMVALAWMVLWFVVHVVDILILLLIAAILAAGLAPFVAALERPNGALPRGVAVLVLYLATFLLFAGIASAIVVPAAAEGRGFVKNLPQLLGAVQGWTADARLRFPWLPAPSLSTALNAIPHDLSTLSLYGATAASAFIGGVGGLVAVFVFAFYMLLEGAQIKRSFLGLFPPDHRERVELVLFEIGAKFGGWLRAQLLLSGSVAAIVTVGMWALGMPFPSLIGVVSGLGELIPLVGPILGGAVAVLIGLSQPLWRLVAVIVFYIIVMNVEPHLLVPRIMSRAVGISPLLALVALLAGVKLAGILGGLLAIPVAAALQVVVSEVVRAIQPSAAPPSDATPVRAEGALTPGKRSAPANPDRNPTSSAP
jgi:predicted PurR-regulated permease PerM